MVIPFAQKDVVANLLNGMHPTFVNILHNELKEKTDENTADEMMNSLTQTMRENYTNRIINTIGVLPKDELALVAETLVNLTSFMRKVSSDMETVGGPVDVALISKKDGFIWVQRKHYFDINKNIHFRYE